MTFLDSAVSVNGVRTDQISVILQEATALVKIDPESTKSRLAYVVRLLDEIAEAMPCEDRIVRILAPWQARRVRIFIEEHLDSPIRIEALAQHTRLSVSYFFRAFRGTFGVPPHAYIMQCRTDRAMALLEQGDDPLAQIAIACGFSDQAHFSRVFAKRAGLPPGAWRRLQRGALSVST